MTSEVACTVLLFTIELTIHDVREAAVVDNRKRAAIQAGVAVRENGGASIATEGRGQGGRKRH